MPPGGEVGGVGTMRAAVLHGPGDLRVEERPVPWPGPTQVLVEVSYCGVCGTDLHMVLDGWGTPGRVGGHEWSGRIAAVGPGVRGWDIGDRVVVGPPRGCGQCRACRADRPSLCAERAVPGGPADDGAFASFVLADATTVVEAPDHLDPRAAALAEPLAVALHAVTQSDLLPRTSQRALVTGAGPIGLLIVAVLRRIGIKDITVSEPNPARQVLAKEVGAVRVVEPGELEVPSAAEPTRMVDRWVHAAFECSGRASAMEAAFAQLGRGGRLVLVGAGMEAPSFDPNRMLLNELSVTGAFEYDEDGIIEAVELLAGGGIDALSVLEPCDVGLDGLLPTIERLAAGTIAGKVLVNPRLGSAS